jgi:hypothetical protein
MCSLVNVGRSVPEAVELAKDQVHSIADWDSKFWS